MTISEAAALVRTPKIDWSQPQSWCDLGCGSGTFTLALAESLAPGSGIYAVDYDQAALDNLPEEHQGVRIRKMLGDLRSPGLRLPNVDGMLMANSLHFIPEPLQLLKKLTLVTRRCFVTVEYERARPSRWVPHPVDFEKLRELFNKSGVNNVEQIATRKSRFVRMMYSAFAERS